MNEPIKLLTGSTIKIQHVAALLGQNNIPSLIKDNTESARLAGFGSMQNDVDLYVNTVDLEKAQQLITDLEKE